MKLFHQLQVSVTSSHIYQGKRKSFGPILTKMTIQDLFSQQLKRFLHDINLKLTVNYVMIIIDALFESKKNGWSTVKMH